MLHVDVTGHKIENQGNCRQRGNARRELRLQVSKLFRDTASMARFNKTGSYGWQRQLTRDAKPGNSFQK